MTDPDQPSPVRLIAVEVMLAADPEDVTALDVLRGLGRQQNRETGLAIARVLQKYCGVAFGLPATNASVKQQTDAVQRVYRWATSKLTGGPVDTPLPGRGDDEDALGGLPPSAYPASAPGLTPPKFKNRR
jgi:hypothetical protein